VVSRNFSIWMNMDSIWLQSGANIDSINLIRTQSGLNVDSAWLQSGFNMDSIEIKYGLHKVSGWIQN